MYIQICTGQNYARSMRALRIFDAKCYCLYNTLYYTKCYYLIHSKIASKFLYFCIFYELFVLFLVLYQKYITPGNITPGNFAPG